jgi:hypothetical protein
MPEPVAGIDFANLPAPNEGIRVARTTHSGEARYLGRRLRAGQHDLLLRGVEGKGAELVTPPIDREGEIHRGSPRLSCTRFVCINDRKLRTCEEFKCNLKSR